MGGNGVLLLLAAVLGFAALHFALRQRRLRRQLSQAAQQLAVILDGGSDEALLVPLCDDALTPLLGQIDRLLLEKKKLCVQQRRARLAQRRMLANMAHDLRTPLTVLLGQLEIARLRGEESETLRRVQAKAEGIMDFCSRHGFGFLLTDGRHTPVHLLRGRVNRRLEKQLKAALATNPIRADQYKAIKESCEATPSQLYRRFY